MWSPLLPFSYIALFSNGFSDILKISMEKLKKIIMIEINCKIQVNYNFGIVI